MNQFFPAQGDRWPHVDQLQHQILRPQQLPTASNWATIPSLYQQQQMALQQLQQQQLQQQQLLHQQQMQQQQRLQEQFGLAAQNQQHHASNNMGGQHLGLGNHQPSMGSNTPSFDYYNALNQNNPSTGSQPPPAAQPAAQRTLPNQSLIHESILRQPQSTPVAFTPTPAPAPTHPPAPPPAPPTAPQTVPLTAPPPAPAPAPAPTRTSFTPNPGAALFHPGAAPTKSTTTNQPAATRAPVVLAVPTASAVPAASTASVAPGPKPPQAPRQPTPQPTTTTATTATTAQTESTVAVTDYTRPRRRSPVQIRLPNQPSAFITELPSRTGSERSKSPPRERPPAADHLRPTQVAPPASAKTSPAAPQPSTGKKLDGLTFVWNRPELQQPALTASFSKQGATTNPPPARPKSSRYEPEPPTEPTSSAAVPAAIATPHRKTPFARISTPYAFQEQRYDRAGWPKPIGAEDSPPSPEVATTLLPAIGIVKMSPTPQKPATEVPRGGRTKEGDEDTWRRSRQNALSPPLQNTSRRQQTREGRLNERASDRGSERGRRDGAKRTDGHGINDIPSSFQMLSGTTLRYVPGTAAVEARWEEALSKTARRKLARQEREQKIEAPAAPKPSATTSVARTDATSPRSRGEISVSQTNKPQLVYGRDVAKYAQGGYGRYSPIPEDLVPNVPPAPKPVDKKSPSPQEKVQHEAVLALLSDVNDKLRSKDGIYTSRALDLASSPDTATSTRVLTAVPTLQPVSPSGRSTPLSPREGVYDSTAPTQANRDDCASSAASWRRDTPAQNPQPQPQPQPQSPPTPLDTFRLLATGEPRGARDTGVLEGFKIVADMFSAFSQLTAAHVDMVRMLTCPDVTPALRQAIEPTLRACSHHLDALHHTLLLTSHIRAEHVRSAWVELGAQPPEF